MIRLLCLIAAFLMTTACSTTYGGAGSQQAEAQRQGLYVRPAWLAPTPVPRIPALDGCQSRLYVGLLGRHEGSIYIPGLPGLKRILKPAVDEGFEYNQDDDFAQPPRLIEVRDYIPSQSLYAPSISTVTNVQQLGPAQDNRLTLELDPEGIVRDIRCE